MPEIGWRNDPLQIVTVSLYDQGFKRFLLQVVVDGSEYEKVVWARCAEEVELRAIRQPTYRNIRVSELPRGRFYAFGETGAAFRGKDTGELHTRLTVKGDTILWPEYYEQEKEQTA